MVAAMGEMHSHDGRAVPGLTAAVLREGDPLGAVAVSAAFAGLSLAAGTVALAGPGWIAGAGVAVALTGAAAVAFLALPRHARDRAASERVEPVAVTTADGAFVAANAAFRAMMAARGKAAHPDALADGTAAALALFALRRRAMAEGHADGFVPPALIARLSRQDGHLVHVFEEVSTASGETAPALDSTMVDLFPTEAVIAEPAGRIRAANAPFRALAGDAETLNGAFTLEEGAIDRLAALASPERVARIDVPLAAAPDRRVRLSAKPLPGTGALLIAVNDVTEQSDLEAHIAQSQKMQAIGQLAGGIAHDFNNVLQAIINFSDLLLQSHRPSDPAFRDIMNIKQNAQRAAGLVKQLLAFSRRQTLRPAVLNLNDVIADLSMMLDRLLGETIHLEIAHGRDLWPVLADLSQIEQVVINLSVNARDAMAGGGTLTIRTRNVSAAELADAAGPDGRLEGDAVLIEVEDVGTGMPQEILDKIFEPFFTTKATGEGTGLGLSTVYGIVKQTGGTLDVQSQEGRGTTFRVYVPRVTAEAEVRPVVTEGSRGPARASDLTGSATVLLVEDEEGIRVSAARALEAKGYRVLTADSGEEAADIFEAENGAVDLLLTDVIMPELDGPSLVRRLRVARPDLKVIFMSGYADGASADELGEDQFLAKPFTLKALAEAVKRELTGAGR